jgi:hypothetical protein
MTNIVEYEQAHLHSIVKTTSSGVPSRRRARPLDYGSRRNVSEKHRKRITGKVSEVIFSAIVQGDDLFTPLRRGGTFVGIERVEVSDRLEDEVRYLADAKLEKDDIMSIVEIEFSYTLEKKDSLGMPLKEKLFILDRFHNKDDLVGCRITVESVKERVFSPKPLSAY